MAMIAQGLPRWSLGQSIGIDGEAMAERNQFGHAAPRLGIGKIVERYPQVTNPHLPQGQERIVVADPLAVEGVQPPGRGYIGTVAPGLAQKEADTVAVRCEAVNGALSR